MAILRWGESTRFAKTETGLPGEKEGVGLGSDRGAFLSACFTGCGRERPPGTGTSPLMLPSDGHHGDSGSGTDAGSSLALPRGSQSLGVRASPSLRLNPRSLKFSKCAAGRRRYFRIWGLEPLILKSQAWQSGKRLYSPVPADTSAPGSLAQQKG